MTTQRESEQTIIARRIADGIVKDAEIMAKELGVPAGYEIVRPAEIKRRFETGTVEQRRELIRVVGADQLMEILNADG